MVEPVQLAAEAVAVGELVGVVWVPETRITEVAYLLRVAV
jgi:hypothetical protein